MSSQPSSSKDRTPNKKLKELKSLKKKQMAEGEAVGEGVFDPYAIVSQCKNLKRGRTGVCTDDTMLQHYADWDPLHPEKPERLSATVKRCEDEKLIRHCQKLSNEPSPDLEEKILRIHSTEHYNKLKEICSMETNLMESEASNYDSIYFNKSTFKAAFTAAACAVNLVRDIAKGIVMNGFAFVRPPGHHAMNSEFNGYCFFNNVAIAAETVLSDKLKNRVLIVDFDVHHGQGTQRAFYGRKDVLYFSIHRYEHGTFWPNLKESNFNYIGEGEGLGYNINVPLNDIDLSDSDYLAIILHVLMPVAYEFNPDFVIVSAGYDSCIGDEKGRMKVTPGFYSHLISLLSNLAAGQVAVILEGGYFIPTLAQGAAMTLKALVGGPCPTIDPVEHIHPCVVDVICDVRRMLFKYWNCFRVCELAENGENGPDVHEVNIRYFGIPEKAPFPTRDAYPTLTSSEQEYFNDVDLILRKKYQAPVEAPVYYAYDDILLRHAPQPGSKDRPERPERLTRIMETLKEFEVEDKLRRMQVNLRNFDPFLTHSLAYVETINPTMKESNDVYVNDKTNECARFAVCSLLDLADCIMKDSCRSAIAIVRPPGHHAEHDKAMGYCFLNNVAITAKYLQAHHKLDRILIVDFDIHHGNGTQNMFYTSKNVMYISIHRDDEGKYFPKESPKSHQYDGYGEGKGFNINIPFNKDKMGDTEYIAAFQNIVLPAAYSYAPQIVIVSAGFDAGINDPLGGYTVSPETFGHFIGMLKGLAEGRLLVALEGGYNLNTTAYGMTMCAKVLLGDPVLMPRNLYTSFSLEAVKSIIEVSKHFKKYYEIFSVCKKLSLNPVLTKKVVKWMANSYSKELSRPLDKDRIHENAYVETQMSELNAD